MKGTGTGEMGMGGISYAFGQNHFLRDRDLQAVLEHFWEDFGAHRTELEDFGQLAGSELYETAYHVDQNAPPVLVAHDLDGRRIDRVRLSPAERAALEKTSHINRPPYEGGSWHHHFAMGYLVGDPGLYCILTITGQTAYAIHKYAPEFSDWKEALLSGQAYGATWMTENQGGSDLGANETVARPDGGRWRLTGDKYFASGAGISDVALVTARPEGGRPGPKGLALFLVPRIGESGALNFQVRRLKDKSATRMVPSGEVELLGSVGHRIGTAEEGIYYTLENLTVSRLANSVAAMSTGKKAHLEVLERVRRRRSFGSALVDHPLIRRDLTDLAVRSAGGLALSFFAVDAFDRAWHDRPPYTSDYHVARLLTHLAKNRTAEHAQAMTAAGMELFGGLGFLEEYAVARWHREALITPIWEGPSNIQTLDFLETVRRHQSHERLLERIGPILEDQSTPSGRLARDTLFGELRSLAKQTPEEAVWAGKHAMRRTSDALQVLLLREMAKTGGERYEKISELYARHFLEHEEYPQWAGSEPDVFGGGTGDA